MLSLDGYMEGPGGTLDWHLVDEEFNDYAAGLLTQVDTLLFGRKTYEVMAAYWPTGKAMQDDPVIAGHMNTLQKVVCSRTLPHADWHNTSVYGSDALERIKALKATEGKDIALLGSCNLASSLLVAGLVDEWRIISVPVVLGGGTPFMRDVDFCRLKFDKSYVFNSGNVLNHYVPAP